MSLRSKSLIQLSVLASEFPGGLVTRTELVDALDSELLDAMPQWLTTNPDYRESRGVYRIPVELLDDVEFVDEPDDVGVEPTVAVPASAPAVVDESSATLANIGIAADISFVPDKSRDYVRWGNAGDIKTILSSARFMPIFVTGLSGNGKTFGIEQECARAKRELFRVNITAMTDEDDLLGGFRLLNGNTVWFDGPVIEAMKRGGVLLLDELDLGTEKIMCLQSVLEGKGVLVKKTNTWVKPAHGFTVIATGNTKGQGDDTDKFVGTNILNEAFLERFPVWLDQPYPTKSVESRILSKLFAKHQIEDADNVISEALLDFASQTRKTFDEGGCDDLITTRRLCLIADLIPVFGNSVSRAVGIACNRFCTETRSAFVTLFSKLYDETAEKVKAAADTASPDAVEKSVAADVNTLGVPF